MCIRDSVRRVDAAVGLHMVGAAVIADHGVEHRGNRIGVDPVSYTHLRAHETVLDLVCRLLLEKKKKQTLDAHYR